MLEVACIVLAAGRSSRMGRFKPLVPVRDQPLVARVVGLFQAAGIEDLRVVVGHQADQLRPVLQTLGVAAVDNPDHASGMFSSVLAGVRSLDPAHRAFFVHPVDVPLVRPETIRRMVARFRETPDRILYPVFGGRRGHPPLIAARFAADILGWNGHGGLRGALAALEASALNVETDDEGILLDVDTEEDFQRFQERLSHTPGGGPATCPKPRPLV